MCPLLTAPKFIQVEQGFVDRFEKRPERDPEGDLYPDGVRRWTERAVIYEVANHISGIQRPMVQAADERGRFRVLES